MTSRDELIAKLKQYVTDHFGGDYRFAFDHYDADHDGTITASELISLFAAVGVGNFLTRGTWAKAVMVELDSDGDSRISWDEFHAVLVKN